MNPTQPIRPLSVGNVVSASFRLYNDNRKAYLKVARRAVGWTFLGLLYLVVVVALMFGGGLSIALNRASGEPGFGLIPILIGFLLILPGIPLWIFCIAKRIYNGTLISRNAYQHLTNQPEAMAQTHRISQRRFWPFWLARVLVGLILYVPNLVASFLQQIFVVVAGVSDATVSTIAGVMIFVVVLASWIVQVWLTARLSVPEVALALEEDLKTANSIPRSWKLTDGQGVRILMVFLVAVLVTLPLYSLAIVPAGLVGALLIPGSVWPLLQSPAPGSASAVGAFFLGLLVALGIYLVLLQLLEILLIPFWQSIKAVIYYDLRSRREGMGLSLSDRT